MTYTTKQILAAEEAATTALDNRLNGARLHRDAVLNLLRTCLMASDDAVTELLNSDDTDTTARFELASQELTSHYRDMGKALTSAGLDDTARRLYERDRKYWSRWSGSVLPVAGDGDNPVYIKFGSRKGELFVTVADHPLEKDKRGGNRAAGEPRQRRRGTGAGAEPRVPESVADFASLAKSSLSEDERVLLAGRLIRELAPEKKQTIIQEIVGELGFTIRRKPAKRQQSA